MKVSPGPEEFRAKAEALAPELVRWRRHLHQHPELANEEFETQEYLLELIHSAGARVIRTFDPTGFVATLDTPASERSVVLRADMDALPVEEQTDTGYASLNPGKMHACGHDVHMSCLIGALKILQDFSPLPGQVYFLFQPAEEKLPGGALKVLESGVLQQINPGLILGQHVEPSMDSGTVGYKPDIYMASSDEVYFTVRGSGGHAALPGSSSPTTLAASKLVLLADKMIGRRKPAKTPTVLAFGRIDAPGATNVIPAQVKIEGTFRTFDEKWRKEAHNLLRDAATQVSDEYSVDIDVDILNGYPVLINDSKLTEACITSSGEYLGEKHVLPLALRMTSEDFAWYSHHFPSVFFRLGVRKPGTASVFRLHSNNFDVDEPAMITGAGHLAWLAFRYLNNGR